MTTFKQFLENNEDQPIRIKLGGNRIPRTVQDEFIKNIHDEPILDKDARSQRHIMNPNEHIFEDEESEAIVVYQLEKGFKPNEIIVKLIQTSPTNRGAGKKFMDRLCFEADALNVTLVLNAVPLETEDRIPATKLIQFYQKFGFINQGDSGKMIRIPNPQSQITENTIPLNIDNLHITKTKAGDGINYTIHDNEKIIGHISGFEQEFGQFEDMFHLYKTELNKETRSDPKYQNKNIYRTAIQKVANLYKNGLFVNKYEASSLLRDSLKKMDTYELVNNEVIIINPE